MVISRNYIMVKDTRLACKDMVDHCQQASHKNSNAVIGAGDNTLQVLAPRSSLKAEFMK